MRFTTMRSKLVPIAVTGAALVAVSALAGPTAANGATSPALNVGTATHTSAVPAKAACYDQNGADTGNGFLSTSTDDPAGYSSVGAADFKVKKKCVINNVSVKGVYGAGTGPADSFTVTFSKSKKGVPGKVVNQQVIPNDNPNPQLTIPIDTVKLRKGKYFVSVQATMDYNVLGGWYWETTATPKGNVDMWENYGGAFGNCTTWGSLAQCFGDSYDFIVTLSK